MARPKSKPMHEVWEAIKNQLYRIAILKSTGIEKDGLCSYLGISKKTYDKLRKTYPEFAEAIKEADNFIYTEIISSLVNTAKKGNVTAIIFYLTNRYPDLWKNYRSSDNEDAISKEDYEKLKNANINIISALENRNVEGLKNGKRNSRK